MSWKGSVTSLTLCSDKSLLVTEYKAQPPSSSLRQTQSLHQSWENLFQQQAKCKEENGTTLPTKDSNRYIQSLPKVSLTHIFSLSLLESHKENVWAPFLPTLQRSYSFAHWLVIKCSRGFHDHWKCLTNQQIFALPFNFIEIMIPTCQGCVTKPCTSKQFYSLTNNSYRILAKKARFARVRAARGLIQAYQGSTIGPTYQSNTLNPTCEVPYLKLFPSHPIII